MTPMTEDKMEAMKGLVRDLARAMCKDQLGKFKQRIGKISQRPQQLQVSERAEMN